MFKAAIGALIVLLIFVAFVNSRTGRPSTPGKQRVSNDARYDRHPEGMMEPYGGAIEACEVGADFGNVKNNRPELMERVGLLRSKSPRPRPPCHRVGTGMSAGAQ